MPTCSQSGAAPLTASGVAFGCVNMPQMASLGVGAYGLTCTQTKQGGIKLGAQFYKNADCTGGTTSIQGYSASFLDINMSCASPLALSYSCEGPILPAAKYEGWRAVTYMDSDVCMGQVFSYANVYLDNVICDNGATTTFAIPWYWQVVCLPLAPEALSFAFATFASLTTLAFASLAFATLTTLASLTTFEYSARLHVFVSKRFSV